MITELMDKLCALFSLPTGALTFKSLEEHVQRTGQELLQALLGLLA